MKNSDRIILDHLYSNLDLERNPGGTYVEKLFLTVACGDYDRTKALQDGSVEPEGIKIKLYSDAVGGNFLAHGTSQGIRCLGNVSLKPRHDDRSRKLPFCRYSDLSRRASFAILRSTTTSNRESRNPKISKAKKSALRNTL